MACEIPEAACSSFDGAYEIVQLSFDEPALCQTQKGSSVVNSSSETAIKITIHGFQIEITNDAASETILHTLSALQRLC